MTYKHWKAPLALAIVLALLSSLVFWSEYKRKPEIEKKEELAKKIFPLENSQVSEILLHKGLGDSQKFIFKCEDLEKNMCKSKDHSNWSIQAPLVTQADKTSVNSLLTALSQVDTVEKIDLSTDTPEKKEELYTHYGISTLGIENNSVKSITITTANNQKTTLYLGETHPIGGNVFARTKTNDVLDTKTVHLIPQATVKHLGHELTHWRNKSIFSFKLSDVLSFELKNKVGAQFSGKLTDGEWNLRSSPSSKPVLGDLDEIESFLNTVAYLNAKEFLSENKNSQEAKKHLQGTTNLIELKLNLKDQKPITLQFKQKSSGPDTKVYALISHLDPLFEVDSAAQNRFNKTLKDLRFLKLISNVEKYTVQKIIFKNKEFDSDFIFTKDPQGKWVHSEPHTETSVKGEIITSLLESMSGKRIAEFSNTAPNLAQIKNSIEVQLIGPEEKMLSHYIFWKPKDKIFAHNLKAKEKETLQLDSALTDLLPWNKEFFFKKQEDN